MEPVTVELSTPVPFGDVTYTSLTFRRKATVRDMRDIPTSGLTMGHMARIAARLTGVPEEVMLRLDMDEFMNLMEAGEAFFMTSLPTGEKQQASS